MKPEEEPWRSETSGKERNRVSFSHMFSSVRYEYYTLRVCVSAAVCNRVSERSQVNPFLCMDLTYIICLLKDGFGFKESTVLQVRLGFWAVWSALSSPVHSHPRVSTADQEGEERGNQLGFGRRDQPLPEVQDSLKRFNHSDVCSSSHRSCFNRLSGRISRKHLTSSRKKEKRNDPKIGPFLIKNRLRNEPCDHVVLFHFLRSSC